MKIPHRTFIHIFINVELYKRENEKSILILLTLERLTLGTKFIQESKDLHIEN